MGTSDGVRVCVQLGSEAIELGSKRRPLWRRVVTRSAQGLAEPADHLRLVRLVRVQLDARSARARLSLQATEHDVERRGLLGYEENGLAVREAVRNQVRDRLRLAGSGRALEDEVLASCGRNHGCEL